MKKQFLLLTVLLFLLGACAPKPAEHSFIKVNADGQFVRDGKPYYFVGANFWYGAILGSQGEGGNRERLHKELAFPKMKPLAEEYGLGSHPIVEKMQKLLESLLKKAANYYELSL